MSKLNRWNIVLVLIMATSMLFITAGSASADLNDGLVAYYPFNGNADEESGNGNHGTVYGATLTTDRFGNPDSAYSFDGVDDYIEVLESPSIDLQNGTDFSLVGWVKTCTGGSGAGPIVSKHKRGYWNGYFICTYPASEWNGSSVFYAASSHDYALSNNSINDCQWHLLVGVFDSSTGITTIYVDGVLQSDTGAIGGGNLDSPANLFLGGHPWDGYGTLESYLEGKLDDVRIYNRTLSESEIQALYGPVAKAMVNLDENDQLILDGSGSYTLIGTIITYEWSLINKDAAGNNFNLSGETTLLDAVDVGCYDVTLTVTDSNGSIGADTTEVCVPACAPTDPDINCEPPETGWKNHGKYVSCVANEVERLVSEGTITQEEGDAIVVEAAQSDVGK